MIMNPVIQGSSEKVYKITPVLGFPEVATPGARVTSTEFVYEDHLPTITQQDGGDVPFGTLPASALRAPARRYLIFFIMPASDVTIHLFGT